jgi:stage V sporulation protein R
MTARERLAVPATRRGPPLFDGTEWTFDLLQRLYEAIESVARDDLGLDVYPNQVEVISSEQMLDAYASLGMPILYRHWSFGKRFARDQRLYQKGLTGLAYEIVINSNPCISYNMEDNSAALHTLVMAHAAFGHNHFFKNNYLFREWTDAGSILDFLDYARRFVAACEERHGLAEVEAVLDAAHALMDHAVFRYHRRPEPTARELQARRRRIAEEQERSYNDLWRTVPRDPSRPSPTPVERETTERQEALHLPEENLLYFLELHSPILKDWQRELLAIVRQLAQYFYPQRQTKVMNEGCATFVHHHIVNTLYDQGRLSDGAMLEILHSHSSVVFQPGFDDPRYSGLNPYALGFNMMCDIKRIVVEPTAEDREWFPDLAGTGDWRAALRHAWANYRDESFIQQYLSPKLIRDMRLFVLLDEADEPFYRVGNIHDERGYRRVRQALARQYDPGIADPDIQVVDADLKGDRVLRLRHTVRDGIPLAESDRDQTLQHLRALWGYPVQMRGTDRLTGAPIYEAGTT